jgi:two-component system sensor histidine kinase PrrB
MTDRLSLHARVVLATVVAVALTLAAVLAVVLSTFAARERDAVDSRLEATVSDVAGRPAAAGVARNERRRGRRQNRRLERVVARSDQGLIVTELDGRETGRFGLAADDPALEAAGSEAGPADADLGGKPYRVLSARAQLTGADGEARPVRLTVFAPLTDVEERIADLRTRVLLTGLAGLLLSVLLATLLSRLALRRLERLEREADALSEPGSALLSRGGPREIDHLSASLNGMLERIGNADAERDAALEASRRFAADAGHELRTPLATMGADLHTLAGAPGIDPSGQEVVGDLLEQQARMTGLLDALQALARGDAGAALERADVDLGDLAELSLEAARARHPQVAFSFAADDDADLRVTGSLPGLRLAVDNLVENAARHGAGRVTVSATAESGGVSLSVDDDGPGIPEDERERVRERFERGRDARAGGSGLGLALVDQQVRLHGGTLELGESGLGGLRAAFALPR